MRPVAPPHELVGIGRERLSDALEGLIRGTIERVGGETPLAKVPSLSECRFCDLTVADCPERVEEARRVEVVGTDLF